MFQGDALFDSMTVWENVASGLMQAHGAPRARAKPVASDKPADVGLDAAAAEPSPAELSGGMQKRVGLARAIAADPAFLSLDDPVAGLGPMLAHGIADLIIERVRALGATAVSITQDVASVRRIADRVAMLWRGRIVWAGPAAHLQASGDPYLDQLVRPHRGADPPRRRTARGGAPAPPPPRPRPPAQCAIRTGSFACSSTCRVTPPNSICRTRLWV